MRLKSFIVILLVNISFVGNSQTVIVDEIKTFNSNHLLASLSMHLDKVEEIFEFKPDSFVFTDGMEHIRFIPNEIVEEALIHKPAKEILIYDSNNQFITKAKFECFVKLETWIESEVMAYYSYESDIKFESSYYYYIEDNKNHKIIDNIKSIETNEELENIVKNTFNISAESDYKIKISSSLIDNTQKFIVGALSIDKTSLYDQEETIESFLFKIENNQIDTLYYQKDNWFFSYIYPTKLIYNENPVYIIGWGYPESDYVGTLIGFWNGKKFETKGFLVN